SGSLHGKGRIVQFDLRKLCWLWLLIAPTAAHAQLWSGPAAVEVRAEDDKGHALAGAHVLVQYTSLKPKDGPPAVETDSRGRANVAGLAEGAWPVEVSHDGFMTYIAEINVRPGGRPEIVGGTQFRVPGGGAGLMRIKRAPRTPPSEAPPVDAVRIRTAKVRTCVECQPGETALSTEWVISGTGNGCGGDLAAKLKAGSVPADLPGGCHVLRIALPAGARYTA